MLEDEPLAEDSAVEPAAPPGVAERWARWVLDGPLALAIALVIAVQTMTWLPHYLSWPYWADHDVFATAARGWVEGRLPYRDSLGNNFPGTIYLFVGLGTLFGWGRPSVWYAFDGALTLTVGLALCHWSTRRFGRLLPGLAGSLAMTSYLLGLDYSHAAQRDWQGPAMAVMAVLLVQARPGRGARIVAGLLLAAALGVRPQTVLFWPGLALAVRFADDPTIGGEPDGRKWLQLGFGLGGGLLILAAPLVVAGVFDEFVQSVALTAYGGSYNRATPWGVLKGWVLQLSEFRCWALPGAILLVASPRAGGASRTALPWLAVFLGVSFHKPLSPVAHSYLDHPLELVEAVLAALLVGLILNVARADARFRLAGVLLVLGTTGATLRPEFCVVGPTVRAIAGLWRETKPTEEPPPGYRKGSVPTSAFYPWRDYQATLRYLRNRTAPGVRVANALKGDPAINAMVDRPTPFPAESIAWLRMVRPADEARFAEALEQDEDAVVVWSPGEVGPDPGFRLERLVAVIQTHYQPEARFGAIEIWRRRPRP
jgi:hypothetical protein